MQVIAYLLFAATLGALILRQVLGRGPGIWAILIVAAAAFVVTGAIPPGAAAAAITDNLPVLALLLALFVFAVALEESGALDHLADWILGRSSRPGDLPFYLFVGFGVMGAFLLNDALVLLGVPLLLSISRRLRVEPTPLLLTLAFSVTVGSVALPVGNPQNILVALDSGLAAPTTAFLHYLLVPTIVNLLLGGLYLRWAFRAHWTTGPGPSTPPFPRIPFWPPGSVGSRILRFPVLLVFPVTMAVLIGSSLYASAVGTTAWPLDVVALAGALAVVLLRPDRIRMYRRINVSVLLLFVGLFIVVAGADRAGILGLFQSILPVAGPGRGTASIVGSILGSSLVGSQAVSNVPWVAFEIPILHTLGYGAGTPIAWMALAAGSTLVGNVTLLGAVSNLIIAQQVETAGQRFRLGPFVQYGLPLTGLTLGVLFLTLLIGI
ncbi:MAG: ArsB/NhaD family transporter [Thermoplasmata archaeon]